jgi:hypothetical protein
MPESSRLELSSCLLFMLESGASGGSAAPTICGANNSTSNSVVAAATATIDFGKVLLQIRDTPRISNLLCKH